MSMTNLARRLAVCLVTTATLLSPVARAEAATISVATFTTEAYAAILGTRPIWVKEDFEALGAAQSGSREHLGPIATSVGTLETIGGRGTGISVVGTGTGLVVKEQSTTPLRCQQRGDDCGRINTTPGGSFYLDSNDTHGILWNVGIGGTVFDRIAFTLSDMADAGAHLRISANGSSFLYERQPNGRTDIVLVSFATGVTHAMIELLNVHPGTDRPRTNDGFGLDDLAVGAIPLPAGAWLLLGGLAGLHLVRRRARISA